MSSMLTVICSAGMPTGERVDIVRRRFSNGEGPRVALVAGVRGDTPEGIRVAHIVASYLQEHHDKIVTEIIENLTPQIYRFSTVKRSLRTIPIPRHCNNTMDERKT